MAKLPFAAPRLFSNVAADPAGIEDVVGTLQHACNARDADLCDSVIAQDVVWGGPTGQVVIGLEALNALHRRLHQEHRRTGQYSRYRVENVAYFSDSVACAHVRRIGTDRHGTPLLAAHAQDIVQEMALYVLVRHEGQWWIAAAQNTPVSKELAAAR
jgi:uncharacterized protein (TIGR02246 family)